MIFSYTSSRADNVSSFCFIIVEYGELRNDKIIKNSKMSWVAVAIKHETVSRLSLGGQSVTHEIHYLFMQGSNILSLFFL